MLKTIPPSNISVNPLRVHKEYRFTENTITPYFAKQITGSLFDPLTDERTNGVYKRVLYDSVKAQFYRNPATSSILTEVGFRDSYASTDERSIGSEIGVISIPQSNFGEGIKRGSVSLELGDYRDNIIIEGTDDYAIVSDFDDDNQLELSVFTWVKIDNFENAFYDYGNGVVEYYSTIVNKRENGDFQWQLSGKKRLQNPTEGTVIEVDIGDGTNLISDMRYTNNQVEEGKWYYVGFTTDGTENGEVNFYINGVSAGTGTLSSDRKTGSLDLVVGKAGFTNNFYLQGNISSMHIHKAKLTPNEITSNYNLSRFNDSYDNSFLTVDSNTIFYVDMDESNYTLQKGTIVWDDFSSFNNNLIFVNSEINLQESQAPQTYVDDTYSNLRVGSVSGSIVGNVFYDRGLIVLTDYYSQILSQFTLNYRATTTIYETEILLNVEEGEFNVSQNPSAVDNGFIKLYNFTSSFDSTTTGGFGDYEYSSSVDPTGSYLTPYITTIGLYDDTGAMVAVAKLPTPIKSLPDYPINFLVRLDT